MFHFKFPVFVLASLLDNPTPTTTTATSPDFSQAATWAANVTSLIRLVGFSLSGGAIALGFIILMFSWGNERREATAKAGIFCAVVGLFGLLATEGIKLLISRIAGVTLP